MKRSVVSKVHRISDILLVILFFLAIGSPLGAYLFGVTVDVSINENRMLEQKPPLSLNLDSITAFPKKYERYFNDHFGFRRLMLMWHNYILYTLLGGSPAPKVVVGKENWLYYDEHGALDDYRCGIQLDEQTLAKWERAFAARDAWLKSQGIDYVVAFVPNKENVYPEFMPDKYNKVGKGSRLEQIIARLHRTTDVKVLNLRDELEKCKGLGFLYPRTESHWNDLGAFIGIDSILQAVSQSVGVRRVALSEFIIGSKSYPEGCDLARFMMTGIIFNDNWTTLVPIHPRRARRVELPAELWNFQQPELRPFAMEVSNPELPRAVMFRDSFADSMIPLISEHFSRIAFWRSPFDRHYIEAERPHLVIEVRSERAVHFEDNALEDPFLAWFLPGNNIFQSGPDKEGLGPVHPLHDCKIEKLNQGLQIQAVGVDPQVEIGPFTFHDKHRYVLKISLDTPADTVLEVFFTRSTRRYYDPKDSLAKAIRKGANDIYFFLPNPSGSLEHVRIDPGACPGNYLVKEIAIKEILNLEHRVLSTPSTGTPAVSKTGP